VQTDITHPKPIRPVVQLLAFESWSWILPHRNAKTVLTNFFVLSIFGQFDYELETRLLKSENHFHAQHLLSRAVDKLTDDHVATI
jgi:hypothetical protein